MSSATRLRRIVKGGLTASVLVASVAFGLGGCAAAPKDTVHQGDQSERAVDERPLELGPIKVASVSGVASKSTRVELADIDAILRSDVEKELATFEWQVPSRAKEFTVSATIVSLETEQTSAGLRSECVVSTAVHHQERGMVAMLRGSALAEDERSAAGRAERNALAAAVKGSLRGLPAAVASID